MKTVGVTGASGHLGNVICRLLTERGYAVKAFYKKDKTALEGLPVELVQGDILDEKDVEKLVSGCDVVIHAAAVISIHGDPTGMVFRTNTEGPANVVKACIANGVKRLIHISSTHAVMELPLDMPFDENRPYKPKGSFAYDFSKATGEQLVLSHARKGELDALVIRPSSVIGPYDFKPSELGKALLDFYHRKIPVLPAGGYDFIDVRDCAASIITAIEKGKSGEVYLLSGKYYTLREFARVVHQVTGKKVPGRVMPFWVLKTMLPPVKWYSRLKKAAPVFTIEAITALKNGHPKMNNEKACGAFNHRCRPLAESIRDFYEWNRLQKQIL